MKIFKFEMVTVLIALLVFGMGSSAIAGNSQSGGESNFQNVVAVQRVVVVTMKAKNGDKVVYEMTDSTKESEQSDGWIDFANFIKVFHAKDASTESQIVRGTKYPITVKIIYFRPGDEVSSSFLNMTSEEWFGGFNARIATCIDANQQIVHPVGGQWKTWTVSEKFMRQLQQLYEKYK